MEPSRLRKGWICFSWFIWIYAKGDLLGKQTLTKDVQDQYVYLKHAITPSTDKTPKEDVKAETVSQVRTISYRDAETGEKITDELSKYGVTC